MRVMPIGNTKEKIFKKLREGSPDDVFNIWANSAQWHSFLNKCGLLPFPEQHRITLFSMYAESTWKSTILYIGYDWLNDAFLLYTIPDFPTPQGYAKAIPFNSWELPGQRFLDNFTEIATNTAKEEPT